MFIGQSFRLKETLPMWWVKPIFVLEYDFFAKSDPQIRYV